MSALIFSVLASSYIGNDGKYEHKKFTIKLHFGDIYNMVKVNREIEPKHFTRSEFQVIAKGDYKITSASHLIIGKKRYRKISRIVHVSEHPRYLEVHLVLKNDEGQISFDQKYQITRDYGKAPAKEKLIKATGTHYILKLRPIN